MREKDIMVTAFPLPGVPTGSSGIGCQTQYNEEIDWQSKSL